MLPLLMLLTVGCEDVSDLEARLSELEDLTAAQDEVIAAQDEELAALQDELEAHGLVIDEVAPLLDYLVVDTETNDVIIEGANFNVRNGAPHLGTVNGLGNLVIGYNDVLDGTTVERTGSHNLVIGSFHSYTSYSCLIHGVYNSVNAPNAATISGNRAVIGSSAYSSVAVSGNQSVLEHSEATVIGGTGLTTHSNLGVTLPD